VGDAVEEVDPFPLLPFVLGEPVRLSRPVPAGRLNVTAAARGLVYANDNEGRWVLSIYNPATGALVQELVLEEFSEGGEIKVYWMILETTGERVLLMRHDFIPTNRTYSLWELGSDGALKRLDASEETTYAANQAVVEPRGLWILGEDSALLDPNTGLVLGTATSLLGIRGIVIGVVGENLLLRTEENARVIVSQHGVVQLTVPSLTGQGLIYDRVAARSDGLLLHSMLSLATSEEVLVGRDEEGGVYAVAARGGEVLPPESVIMMVFQMGGAPYMLVHGSKDMLVYPILPMP